MQTPSGNANTAIHMDVTAPSTVPDHAVVLTGVPCYTTYGPTTDTKVTITPSGAINAECHYHA